jgi:hypothetical protein
MVASRAVAFQSSVRDVDADHFVRRSRDMTVRALAIGIVPWALACGANTADEASDRVGTDAAGESGVSYSGTVVASMNLDTQPYALYAQFQTAANPSPSSGAADAGFEASCYAWQPMVSLPTGFGPGGSALPTAGSVTIARDGAPLATLLGPSYPEITNVSWTAGDTLDVQAAGGDVDAFAGSLQTPATLQGLSPAFGQGPIAIASGTDFQISWTPEGKAGEIMQVQIESDGAWVSCTASDSDGSVVIGADLIAQLSLAANPTIHLIRSITSNVLGPNATVALEGQLWLGAPAIIQ